MKKALFLAAFVFTGTLTGLVVSFPTAPQPRRSGYLGTVEPPTRDEKIFHYLAFVIGGAVLGGAAGVGVLKAADKF